MNPTAYISTAGSGKTSALVRDAKTLPKALAITYTNRMADELSSRMPTTVNCSTVHSLAGWILWHLYNRRNKYKFGSSVFSKACKEALINATGAMEEDPYPFLQWAASCDYSCLLLDEAQDLFKESYLFIREILKLGITPIIALDPNQSIYEFQGGSPTYASSLIKEFKMEVVPLDINYRCPPSTVELSNFITGENAKPDPNKVEDTPVNLIGVFSQGGFERSFQDLVQTYDLSGRTLLDPWRYSFKSCYLYLTEWLPKLETIHALKGAQHLHSTLILDGVGLEHISRGEVTRMKRLLNVGVTRNQSSLDIIVAGFDSRGLTAKVVKFLGG